MKSEIIISLASNKLNGVLDLTNSINFSYLKPLQTNAAYEILPSRLRSSS